MEQDRMTELQVHQTAQALVLQVLLNAHINLHDDPDEYRERLHEALVEVGEKFLDKVGESDKQGTFEEALSLLFSQ